MAEYNETETNIWTRADLIDIWSRPTVRVDEVSGLSWIVSVGYRRHLWLFR